jgi:DNA repair protein RecO (recombination protein O)
MLICIFGENRKPMLEKSKGIVLHQIKHTDSGIIAQVYTRNFGRQSLIIKGIRSKKKGRQVIFFQPLFILDLEIYFKPSREIQLLKEFSVSYTPADIPFNVVKSTVALFLGEVLYSTLKEESPQQDLFDFIENSIIFFDKCTEGIANFHISFLTGLTRFLGFEPGPRLDTDNTFFDMINGVFVPMPPLHGKYCNPEISTIIADFLVVPYEKIGTINLSGHKRNEVLESILYYYSIHLPGLKTINSISILKEVFR